MDDILLHQTAQLRDLGLILLFSLLLPTPNVQTNSVDSTCLSPLISVQALCVLGAVPGTLHRLSPYLILTKIP